MNKLYVFFSLFKLNTDDLSLFSTFVENFFFAESQSLFETPSTELAHRRDDRHALPVFDFLETYQSEIFTLPSETEVARWARRKEIVLAPDVDPLVSLYVNDVLDDACWYHLFPKLSRRQSSNFDARLHYILDHEMLLLLFLQTYSSKFIDAIQKLPSRAPTNVPAHDHELFTTHIYSYSFAENNSENRALALLFRASVRQCFETQIEFNAANWEKNAKNLIENGVSVPRTQPTRLADLTWRAFPDMSFKKVKKCGCLFPFKQKSTRPLRKRLMYTQHYEQKKSDTANSNATLSFVTQRAIRLDSTSLYQFRPVDTSSLPQEPTRQKWQAPQLSTACEAPRVYNIVFYLYTITFSQQFKQSVRIDSINSTPATLTMGEYTSFLPQEEALFGAWLKIVHQQDAWIAPHDSDGITSAPHFLESLLYELSPVGNEEKDTAHTFFAPNYINFDSLRIYPFQINSRSLLHGLDTSTVWTTQNQDVENIISSVNYIRRSYVSKFEPAWVLHAASSCFSTSMSLKISLLEITEMNKHYFYLLVLDINVHNLIYMEDDTVRSKGAPEYFFRLYHEALDPRTSSYTGQMLGSDWQKSSLLVLDTKRNLTPNSLVEGPTTFFAVFSLRTKKKFKLNIFVPRLSAMPHLQKKQQLVSDYFDSIWNTTNEHVCECEFELTF